MNDFLKKMRTANDTRFDRQRRQYVNPQYINNQKNGKDNRKSVFKRNSEMEQLANLISETLPIIRSNIEDIADTQRQMAEMAERRTIAEERKAQAMETIVTLLKDALNGVQGVVKQKVDSLGKQNASDKPIQTQAIYDPEPEKPKAPSKRERNAVKEKVIHLIKHMRDNGSTYSQIANHLEQNNIATFSGKGKWHPQTVQKLYRS